MTAAAGTYQVRAAVYAALAADATLAGYVGTRIYADVPDNASVYPYVAIGDASETPADALDTTVHDVRVVVHVWESRENYEGELTTAQALDAVVAALDGQQLTITGGQHIYTRRELSQIFRDGDFYHGVARFAVLYQES